MLHYPCNTTCYHLCTVLLHSLGSQNIILFTILLYSIYSVNFTIFTYTVLLLYRISFYVLSLITIFFCPIYPSFVHFYFNVWPTLTITVLLITFFCCNLSKSIDSIYSLNTFLCFVISSNLFAGHFICVLSWSFIMSICFLVSTHWNDTLFDHFYYIYTSRLPVG